MISKLKGILRTLFVVLVAVTVSVNSAAAKLDEVSVPVDYLKVTAKIYRDLLANTMVKKYPALVIDNSPGFVAYATSEDGNIHMSQYTLRFLYNLGGEDLLAAVIAHEITHIEQKDIYSPPSTTVEEGKAMEERADKLGVWRAERSGYPKASCGAAKMFEFFVRNHPQTDSDVDKDDHPSDKARAKYSRDRCNKVLDRLNKL